MEFYLKSKSVFQNIMETYVSQDCSILFWPGSKATETDRNIHAVHILNVSSGTKPRYWLRDLEDSITT